MSDIVSVAAEPWYSRQRFFSILLFAATFFLSVLALYLPNAAAESSLALNEGDVASLDILAPRTLSFESAILTTAQQEESALAVEAIYGPPDANVARDQVQKLGSALAFIESVREESFASQEQRLADLAALQNINLGQERAIELLGLSSDAWSNVQAESRVILDQIMRSTIRQDQVESARISAQALVSLSLPEQQALIAADLAAAFVAPNSFFSESLTEIAREEARGAVAPIIVTVLADEILVERGQVLSAADRELLEQFGLVDSGTRWQDYVGSAAILVASFLLIFLYFRYQKRSKIDSRTLLFFAILFVIFLFGARFLVVGRAVSPYIYPVAAFGLVVSTIAGTQLAIVLAFSLSLIAAYNFPIPLELSVFYFLGSWVGILVLRSGQRLMSYIWAGLALGLTGVAVVLAFRLPLGTTDLLGIATLVGASLLNGFIAATLTIVLQLAVSSVLGLTTAVQLQELSRPDHPLLQFVLRNAPGTYQHSLQISNLAEQAAERIGANTLLTRVGSLYHDAGKARQPIYFIENQVPGTANPHNDLSPLDSSQIIIRHVADGLELAEKHRLPRRIRDFIAEHHGDLITQYQYGRALEAVEGDKNKVDPNAFRYPGPKPQSRETALVMLADGCEARTRAERPATRDELNLLVRDVIDNRLAAGQLDHTELTMNDLAVVQESFVSTLRGIYHPRINYPKIESAPPTEISAPDDKSKAE
jgi:hypothetical protein